MTDVILVDEQDNERGTAEKLDAHKRGVLHRAFSLFIFNRKGQLLLQQRAAAKYHCGGLWTNTCCSHPAPGESVMNAAHRRLQEEMGFDCPLTEAGSLTYRAEFDNGLTEHEFDHLLIGVYEDDPVVNPEEADAFLWADTSWLTKDIIEHPEKYTPWFTLALDDILKKRATLT